ncbi:MFS transporter [Halobium salinum]|uniref:MFS transporter n=1 Tax=Halobium salinum TaxID=1364940 RepID=A0ABD5PEZ0_9EURY|nr:MFS transporter [Halobium salinum]
MSDSRRVVLAVIVSTFFVGFGGGVVFPILPNLEAVLGISPFVVGLILSANRFTRLVANAPAGSLVDRVGTRRPFVAGLAIEGVATFGYVFALGAAAPAVWFLAARVAWGIGSALVFATAYTITADVSTGPDRGTSMGLVRAGITFGFPAGLFLGGVVSDAYSVEAAFTVAAAFALLASGVAYLTVPETHVGVGTDGSGDRTNETASRSAFEVDRSVPAVTAGLVNFGLYFSYVGVLFATLVLLLGDRGFSVLGYAAQGTSGVLMAATVLSGSVFMLVGGSLSDRLGARVPVLLAFLGVACVGFLLLVVAETLPTFLLGCLCVGGGQGGVGGPLMALLADLTPGDRMGRATGTTNLLGDVGGGLGPLVSLPLVQAVGFAPVYAACALIPLLAGGVLVAGVYRHTGSMSPRTGAVRDGGR